MQALYACRTCSPDMSNFDAAGGICVECSFTCHDGHDLIEIYTKRHFRCDCGNSKFPTTNPCQLMECKPALNVENQYNQNFTGRYCQCHRPYPDAERQTPEIMYQCIACEDWCHVEHLGQELTPPLDPKAVGIHESKWGEVICGSCMNKYPYLKYYAENVVPPSSARCGPLSAREDLESVANVASELEVTPLDPDQELPPLCYLQQLKNSAHDFPAGFPGIWKEWTWRETLCQCDPCLKLYEKDQLMFLLASGDSLTEYENRNKAKSIEKAYTASANAISKTFSQPQQVEMAMAYQDLSSKIKPFLQQFAQDKKVVSVDDIEGFFHTLKRDKSGLSQGQESASTVKKFRRDDNHS